MNEINDFLKKQSIKTRIVYGNAPDAVEKSVSAVPRRGKIIIVTSDSAYFAVGKSIKDRLFSLYGEQTVCFCADDGRVSSAFLTAIYAELACASCVVVAGGGELIRACKYLAGRFAYDNRKNFLNRTAGNACGFIIVAVDCDFGDCLSAGGGSGAFSFAEESFFDSDEIILDERVISAVMKKQRTSASLKRVLAGNLLFIESAVYEVIHGFSEKNKIENCRFALKKSQAYANEYFKTRKTKVLALAELYCGLAARFCPTESPARVMSRLMGVYGIDCYAGEREYRAYELLLNLYEYYLSGEFDFCGYIPSISHPADRAGKTFGIPFFEVSDLLPAYLYMPDEIKEYKEKLRAGCGIFELIKKQKELIGVNEKHLKTVFAGRKLSDKLYSRKQWNEALSVAPFVAKGDCLLKIIWANGLLEGLYDL